MSLDDNKISAQTVSDESIATAKTADLVQTQTAQKSNSTDDDNNIAMLVWVLTILFSFFPALIAYLAVRHSDFVKQSSKEILNMQITIALISMVNLIVAVIFSWTIVVPIIAWVLGVILTLAYIVFCIIGAMRASKGEIYKIPMIFRWLK